MVPGAHRPPQILRNIAESELRAHGFAEGAVDEGIPGQWWCPPYGGPSCFLQWVRSNPLYVDEEQLRLILSEYQRYRPLSSQGRH
jgi:hypothetical protein